MFFRKPPEESSSRPKHEDVARSVESLRQWVRAQPSVEIAQSAIISGFIGLIHSHSGEEGMTIAADVEKLLKKYINCKLERNRREDDPSEDEDDD